LAKTKVKVARTIERTKAGLASESNLSSEFKETVSELLEVVVILSNRLNLNSSNSSKPPSQDPNRSKKSRTAKAHKRKPGGQNGHKGHCLKQIENPTTVEDIVVDRRSLPKGNYESVGFEARQVFDLEISMTVTEYRAEILRNERGVEFMADFPDGVTEPAQYGNAIRATSVYMSQSQLIPQDRVRSYFNDQLGLSVSKGSVGNWNALAYRKLIDFEAWARAYLINSLVNNVDETGINVNGKRIWLHCVSNEKVTLFHADEARGQEAMDRMGILPVFKGILVHDHWKVYFRYSCEHSLCNAHHIRELQKAIEEDGSIWSKSMQDLLKEINDAVHTAGGVLDPVTAKTFRKKYARVIDVGQVECPQNLETRAQTTTRNLLERLQLFENETLRFMEDKNVPFTNNQGENDLRMTKVQQKISGCFRSMEGAQIFCRVRSYLQTCRKNGINPTQALKLLFDGERPSFMT
jgi:transposase